MPVSEKTPQPLKTALNRMEEAVQGKKSSLAYAAPEMHDLHWGDLQNKLAGIIVDMHEAHVNTRNKTVIALQHVKALIEQDDCHGALQGLSDVITVLRGY